MFSGILGRAVWHCLLASSVTGLDLLARGGESRRESFLDRRSGDDVPADKAKVWGCGEQMMIVTVDLAAAVFLRACQMDGVPGAQEDMGRQGLEGDDHAPGDGGGQGEPCPDGLGLVLPHGLYAASK